MLKHPTISAWQRDEDGSYRADIRGHALRVRWIPERPQQHRGFVWEVTSPSGLRVSSLEVHEEIEVAMAEAESHVAAPPVAPELNPSH